MVWKAFKQTWKREWEKLDRAKGISVNAKRINRTECKGNPTKGLTFEELGCKNGNKKDGRRRTGGLPDGDEAERI